MSLELINTLASVGTFLVIAATAITALVQLRHVRGSNQIVALNELRESIAKPEFQESEHFIRSGLPDLLKDPAFRYQLAVPEASTPENRQRIRMVNLVANFYEGMGLLVKAGLVNRALALDMWSARLDMHWNCIAPVTAILRRKRGKGLWENFEYLAVLSEDWIAANRISRYPAGVRRKDLRDSWLSIDTDYAASIVETTGK